MERLRNDTVSRSCKRRNRNGRGLKSKRIHDLETASKTTRFLGVYTKLIQPLNPTVYVKAISFSGLCASSIGARFDQTRVRRLSSPRPNPESSLAFLFVTLQDRIGEKVNISRHLCLFISEVWLSVYKIHESCKSEVKPQIKVLIVQQSAALRARFTIFTSRASQFRSRPFLIRRPP